MNMYRQMTRESPLPQIYCAHEKLCDGFCGKFHAERLLQRTNVRHLVGAIEAAAIKASTHNEQMARVKGSQTAFLIDHLLLSQGIVLSWSSKHSKTQMGLS